MNALHEMLRAWAASGADSGWLPSTFQYAFVVNALLSGLVIGPLLGAVGTMVVAKRLAFFSQAIGHAALTGVAVGILAGEPYTQPFVSLFAFCILFALAMNFARNHTRISSDTIIGVFLAISLAIGASLLLFVTARINVHVLDTIMFGSILTVNDTDLNILWGMTLVTLIVGLVNFNRMLLSTFNPALARVRGIRVRWQDYLFILLITLLTVASVKIVGAILVEALLLIPAAAARNIARDLRSFVAYSCIIATISCLVGILVPLQFNLPVPSGGAIIMVAAVCFLVSLVLRAAVPALRDAA
ncbi:MAG: iron chelate uptake ABC transporter family permease subunit [Candidatus Hydrogenedens sp.]|nr:iron chelate uptake ABC transporter family permease subunit [Candidatus Hydrogenedens sp.]